jgi:hypothetical protein
MTYTIWSSGQRLYSSALNSNFSAVKDLFIAKADPVFVSDHVYIPSSYTVVPVNSSTFYGFTGTSVYRTIDNGTNWTLVDAAVGTYHSVNQMNSNYAVCASKFTTDGGLTWTSMSSIPADTVMFRISNTGRIFAVTNTNSAAMTIKYSDDGSSWSTGWTGPSAIQSGYTVVGEVATNDVFAFSAFKSSNSHIAIYSYAGFPVTESAQGGSSPIGCYASAYYVDANNYGVRTSTYQSGGNIPYSGDRVVVNGTGVASRLISAGSVNYNYGAYLHSYHPGMYYVAQHGNGSSSGATTYSRYVVVGGVLYNLPTVSAQLPSHVYDSSGNRVYYDATNVLTLIDNKYL